MRFSLYAAAALLVVCAPVARADRRRRCAETATGATVRDRSSGTPGDEPPDECPGRHAWARVAIFARGGRDELAGTARHDVLNGGPGFDTVEATPGNDRCISLEHVIDGPC